MPKPNALETIKRLYDTGLQSLARDVRTLEKLSKEGKLSERHARDLRDYMKLLGDLKKAHQAIEDEAKAKERALTQRIIAEQKLSNAQLQELAKLTPLNPAK